ncbi:DUF2290 domain-containing protein [Bacillus cereus]|uniref:DUF2290 domain-containing protein n=1 Tax=Bacillus cereus TaxID=1396 RepID=UPI0018F66FC2|nr:DUF2290 domain-containing protein [Bacillus cereus]MBJ7965797.1 DUF2290 domain-containing protein [Bacillus cereus]MBJ8002562.1 DUF2290 domain-containing protein [Bacillus cereus]
MTKIKKVTLQSVPLKNLQEQFNTVNAMYQNDLIIDSIKPLCQNNIFTFKNDVHRSDERSPMSAKFFNNCVQYLAMFRSRSYHFLLFDASIIRFYYKFDNANKLESYNLLWFPCPFNEQVVKIFGEDRQDLYNFLDDLSNEDKFSFGDFEFRTPIRVDYDALYSGTKKDFHPTSHIHFQNTNTRAKNNNIFCIYTFMAFIIENCYPEKNAEYHNQENNLNGRMRAEKSSWLKINQINDEKIGLGNKIFTNYHF